MKSPLSIGDLSSIILGLDTADPSSNMTVTILKSRGFHVPGWYAIPPTSPRGEREMLLEVDLPVGIPEWYVEVQEWAHAELAEHGYAYEAVHWIEPDAVVIYGGRTAAKSVWRWYFDDLTAATLFKLRWVG